MFLSPHAQGAKKGAKFTPLVGNDIFGPGWMLGVSPSLNDSVLLKYFEAGRKRIRAHSRKRALKVLKLARALENEIAQDQHGPSVADDIERPGYRAELCVVDGHHGTA